MKINIVIPFMPFKPGGGLRVMFEYANHLTSLGHQVILYYPAKVAFLKQNYFKAVVKYLLYRHRAPDVLNWFKLDARVKVKCIFNIENKTIADGDIVFSTWWSLMFEIKKLSAAKGKVFNLIQDIETWFGYENEVRQSYTIADSNNVVIARYLYNHINDKTGKPPLQIPFAIDHTVYKVTNPAEQRDSHTVCMMYSIEPRKGSAFGLDAMKLLKLRYPLLKVILFSVADAPAGLPDWFEYYKGHSKLAELYNQASIFLGPSIQEGCALPPMEAMHCGCAIVCTDIDGHKEYAFDGETAIMARSQDANDMAEKIGSLIEDNALRLNIACRGNEYIKKYTWSASTQKLEAFFNEAIHP